MQFHRGVVRVRSSCNGSLIEQSAIPTVSTLKGLQHTPEVHKNPKLSAAIDKQGIRGSTIVDGPEVPEDRDPAQREAEGPRSSMDYSEFPLLDFSHQKKTELQRHHTA